MGGTERRKNVFLTATLLPTFIFAFVFLLDLFLIFAESSGAVPFGPCLCLTLIIILITDACFSNRYYLDHCFTLVLNICAIDCSGRFLCNSPRGAHLRWWLQCVWLIFLSFVIQPIPNPVSVNQIPRQIPPPPKYLKPWVRTTNVFWDLRLIIIRIAVRDFDQWYPALRLVIFHATAFIYCLIHQIIRCRLCWVILRDVKSLRLSCILRIWFPSLNGRCCSTYQRNCDHSVHLHHALCRRIQVALEVFLHRWWKCLLGVGIWFILLGFQTLFSNKDQCSTVPRLSIVDRFARFPDYWYVVLVSISMCSSGWLFGLMNRYNRVHRNLLGCAQTVLSDSRRLMSSKNDNNNRLCGQINQPEALYCLATSIRWFSAPVLSIAMPPLSKSSLARERLTSSTLTPFR